MAKIDFTLTPGDYTYTQDEYGKSASGVIKVGTASQRDTYLQRTVGGGDRQPGDHGGHLIAHSLGGRNDETNLDPQNANVNQMGQRSIERDITRLASDPNKTVFVDVQNFCSNGSQRPDVTMMTVGVQDKTTGNISVDYYSFQNASYEEQAQWDAMVMEDMEYDPRQEIGMTPEERALADEYADAEWDIRPGEGHTTFFDETSTPVTADADPGPAPDDDPGAGPDPD